MIRARIELIRMCNLNSIADLHLRSICPLIHQLLQIQHIIDRFVHKLFLENLVCLIFEEKVDPLERVKKFYCLYKEIVVDISVNDVVGKKLLELHNDGVHSGSGHYC